MTRMNSPAEEGTPDRPICILGEARKRPGPKPRFTCTERALRKKAAARTWLERNEGYHTNYRNRRPWFKLISDAKIRAKRLGIPFDLTSDWGTSIWTGRCVVTGLDFVIKGGLGVGPGALSPSLDRIDPSRGYTVGNCRFVIHAFNAMKGSMLDDAALVIAREIHKGLSK